MNIKKYIVDVNDFPKKGVIFKDLTNILKNPDAYQYVIDQLSLITKEFGADSIAAPGARGYWFAPLIAQKNKIPFIPIRKKGKLPPKKFSEKYELEYGFDFLEIKQDAFQNGEKVVIFDDILATGGTVDASTRLVKRAGGVVVGCIFLGEIKGLNGYKILKVPYKTLVTF